MLMINIDNDNIFFLRARSYVDYIWNYTNNIIIGMQVSAFFGKRQLLQDNIYLLIFFFFVSVLTMAICIS